MRVDQERTVCISQEVAFRLAITQEALDGFINTCVFAVTQAHDDFATRLVSREKHRARRLKQAAEFEERYVAAAEMLLELFPTGIVPSGREEPIAFITTLLGGASANQGQRSGEIRQALTDVASAVRLYRDKLKRKSIKGPETGTVEWDRRVNGYSNFLERMMEGVRLAGSAAKMPSLARAIQSFREVLPVGFLPPDDTPDLNARLLRDLRTTHRRLSKVTPL